MYEAQIDGEEADALKVKEVCRDVASRVRVAYGWMYHWSAAAIFLLFYFGMLAWGSSRITKADEVFAWAIFCGLAPGVLALVLWYIRRIAFPRVVFLLGQEKQRNDFRQYWRRWGITGLIAAPIIALVVRGLGSALKL